MKKLLVAAAAALLLGGLCAFGQNKAPANLVDVVVTNFDVIDMSDGLYVAPTSRTFNTAQHAFDAIDDKLGDLMLNSGDWNSDGWDYLLGGTNSGYVYPQPVADWIDDNWGIDTNGWANLSPTNRFNVDGEASVPDVFNWIDSNWVRHASQIPLSTDNFQFVGVAATDFWCPPTNVQRFADWIDDYGQYVESTNWQRLGVSSWPTNLPWLPLSTVLEWLDTNAMWGTNIFAQTYGSHAARQWSGPRTLGWSLTRVAADGIAKFNKSSVAWTWATNVMTSGAMFDGGGAVSVSAVNKESSVVTIPVTGEYVVSAQMAFGFKNESDSSAAQIGIGFDLFDADETVVVQLASRNMFVAPGASNAFTLSYCSVVRAAAGDYCGLRISSSLGWANVDLSSAVFSGYYISR